MTVDLIIINGIVRTLDAADTVAQAVAIIGNRIFAVGSTAALKPLAGPRTRMIDAGGRLGLPGFNDAHVHFLMGGFQLGKVDLRDAKSPREFIARRQQFAQKIPAGQWITGGDWDHE